MHRSRENKICLKIIVLEEFPLKKIWHRACAVHYMLLKFCCGYTQKVTNLPSPHFSFLLLFHPLLPPLLSPSPTIFSPFPPSPTPLPHPVFDQDLACSKGDQIGKENEILIKNLRRKRRRGRITDYNKAGKDSDAALS